MLQFPQLIEKLIPGKRVMGCQINILDSVFFENGKPKMYLKNERDNGCIIQVNRGKNLLANVQKFIMDNFNERKKSLQSALAEKAPTILENIGS